VILKHAPLNGNRRAAAILPALKAAKAVPRPPFRGIDP